MKSVVERVPTRSTADFGVARIHRAPFANSRCPAVIAASCARCGMTAGMGDLSTLAAIHNGEQSQAEHCLRSAQDDWAAGDTQALEHCRAFILSELAKAQGVDQEIDL